MEYLNRLYESLRDEGVESSNASLTEWNDDIESFLASNPVCDGRGLSDADADKRQEFASIESNVSILQRGIISAVETNVSSSSPSPSSPSDGDDSDNSADQDAIIRTVVDRFVETKECHDLERLAIYVRASKNLLRWFLQIFLDLRGRVVPCPIRLLQSLGTLELMVSLLKHLDFSLNRDDMHRELARNISLFLFYATYNPFAGDETSQKALSHLIKNMAFPELTLELLTKPCSAALALSLVRNIHNAMVSLEGAAKIIMEARFAFDAPETESLSAPWAPTESTSVGFRSILIDTIRWALESDPSFPGDDADKRAELVTEILGVFYALRVGQGLVPSKCEPGIMELVSTTLGLPSNTDSRIMQVKLSTTSLLMDSDPSFGGYLLEKEAVQPLLEMLESQVTDVVDSARVDNAAVSSLVPTLVVLHKYSASDAIFRDMVKQFIFPLDAEEHFQTKVREQIATTESKNMGPLDAPKNTIRWKLISLLTWTQSHIKRCTGELLWTICAGNATEFVHRVGFGNALPILSSRGLAQMPTGTTTSAS
jgi:hypothetical protein